MSVAEPVPDTAAWQAPASTLVAALGLAGHCRTCGANEPLALGERGRVWLVLSGSVDLFLVDQAGRYPIVRVPAGGLIDSLTSADAAIRFVGLPSADAVIVETTRAALAPLASHETAGPSHAEAWQHWLAHLCDATTPAPSLTGVAAGSTEFDALCEHQAAAMMARLLEHRRASLAARASERTASSHAALQDFDVGLGRVIDLVGIHEDHEEEGETLADAAAHVLRALGWDEAELHVDVVPGEELTQSIQRIARDNGLQFRVVDLATHWWRQDHGPMLGTVGPGRQPCALVRSRDRYLLHAGRRAHVVDDKIGGTIDRTAYVFYTPFPDAQPGAWDLLRFGLTGARFDVRNIVITLLLSGLFSLVTPIATGWVMDPIIPDAETSQARVITGLLIMLAIGMTATFVVQSLASLRLEARSDNRVQAAIWLRVLNLKVPFFRDYTAGDLANRADGINAMRKLLGQSFTTFASGTVGVVFSVALMFYYEWRVAIPVAIVAGLFAVLASLIGRRVIDYNYRSLELTGQLQGTVLQLLGSIAKLRIAGAERQAFLAWLNVYRRSVALNLRQRLLSNRMVVMRTAFGPIVTVVVLIVLGIHGQNLFAFFQSDSNKHLATPLMSVADFVSFNVALGQLVGYVMSLARASLLVVMLQPYYRRVLPILTAEQEPEMQGAHVGDLAGEIELRDVRFRYTPDAPLALRGLSLKIPAGRTVALIGPSGAGKSSIVRLLLGFDSPESGEVYVDNTDLRFMNVKELRQSYGVVLQNGRLLAGSIYDNIAAGLPFPPEQVMDALRLACLDKDVAALPMGLHTNIADGGVSFSGGQRQRLMIARAVIRRPRILIMDEATSALDNVTQKTVVDNLKEMNCTQIVIAQRLSTIVSADLIHVVEAGQVVESGTYAELMEHGSLFKQLAQRQL